MDIITCREVVKRFDKFTALDKVSLTIPKGRIFGLLGPNGAGKTTLLRILNQITVADEGEILFNGRPISPTDIVNIGYLPEERGLYKKMKVGDQALYFARLKGMKKGEAIEQLKRWFIKFEIEEWWDKKVEELSKGMAQKVQFITTILHNPSLLILDEPFSGFDPVNVQLIRSEIIRMKDEGATIVLSTHNMESVEELCDDIALINKAKLVVTGELNEVRRRHGKNEVELIYRGAARYNFKSLPQIVAMEEGSSDEGHKVLLELERGESPVEFLRELAPQLDIVSYRELIPRMEDLFIQLVS